MFMQQYPLLRRKLHIPPIRSDPSTRPEGVGARLVSRPLLIERLKLGMTVVSILLGFLPEAADISTQVTLLWVGLSSLALAALQKA
jgi:hypothetical protein